MTRVGRWSSRRPGLAIAAWVVFVVVALAFGAAAGTKTLENGAVGESARGYSIMDETNVGEPDREVAYIKGKSSAVTVSDPEFAAAARDAARRLSALGLQVRTSVSPDRRSAIVAGEFHTFVPIERVRGAIRAVAADHPSLSVAETGSITANQARDDVVNRDLHRAELVSIPVTVLVLLFAFGAVVAALVPVMLGLTAVAAAFGLLGPLSQLFPIEDSAKTVVLLIGLAVGVDYSLFYIIRSRQERRRGAALAEALETTSKTSGRTVIVSGTTVAIAMAGIYMVQTKVLSGIATGTIAVVACAVAGSVTALPAVLSLLGPRIDRGRIPFLPGLRTEGRSRFWPAVVNRVLKRPVLALTLSVGVLVMLAFPALSLHVSKPGDLALAGTSEPALKTLAEVRREFPGAAETAIVALRGPARARPEARAEIAELRRQALTRGIVHGPIRVSASADRTAAAVVMPLSGDGANGTSRNAVEVLRQELIPKTVGRVPGLETAVTGQTAEDVDFTHQMRQGLPYVIGFVLVLAFLLLLFAFRSIVVPLKAIVLNLLSVGAAYGVLVLVFQHRWAEPILGFESNGAIIAWLPLFLFVILFGLSMDYHVFILSRIRELVDRGESTDDAIRHGITATAGVVTSAALVMVCVFALFGTLSSLELKQTGVGLAVAVLLDATLIRGVALPASMKLLGDWNWYLPRALRRLPLPHAEHG